MQNKSGSALALLFLLAGCGGGGSSTSDSGTTQLNLAISDAPVDSVQQVCIAVSGINLNSQTGWGPLALLNTTNNEVHRVFPGKAALIFRKKYSESLNP